jgi:uncharacterized MAPEG superfamily protein
MVEDLILAAVKAAQARATEGMNDENAPEDEGLACSGMKLRSEARSQADSESSFALMAAAAAGHGSSCRPAREVLDRAAL